MAATKKNAGRTGRPKKDIAKAQVETLASIGCTMEEIGLVVGCDRATLQRRFSAAVEKGRNEAKVSLRRAQYKTALRGNATMLIWLGKQYLGQTDKLPDFSKLTDEQLLAIASGAFSGDDENAGPKVN